MILLKKIDDISYFEVKGTIIFALKGEVLLRTVLTFNSNFKEYILLKHKIIPYLQISGSVVWIYLKEKTQEYSYTSDLIFLREYVNYSPRHIYDSIIVGDFKAGDNRFLQARRVSNQEVVWNLSFTSPIIYFGEYIYLVEFCETLDKRSINAINKDTGQIVWRYTLSETEVYYNGRKITDIQIANLLGVYNNLLWIVLNTGHFIGLSINDGSLIHHLKMPFNFPDDWKKYETFSQAERSVLDTTEGKIFGIRSKIYWEIDLQNPETMYKYFDVSETCEKNNIEANLPGEPLCWQRDEIFIGQQEWSTNPSYVGIFNRKTKEITWTSHEIGEPGIFKGLTKIAYAKTRLYVLDAQNTLHILERESMGGG